jgi:hypothetical protein
MSNRYPGKCHICGTYHAAGAASLHKTDIGWVVQCTTPCQPKPVQPQAPAAKIGDLSRILALFAKARQHLKFPAVVAGIPALAADGQWARDDHGDLVWSDHSFRINVAGDRAKHPGTLTVVDAARDEESGDRDWFGRILLDGAFQASQDGAAVPGLAKRLVEFAADPARVAGEDGRLHGRCCFCRQALTDERSTAVGYGKTCARHFGLPWGSRPEGFAEGVERRMQAMEAEADRAETLRDEINKHRARAAMEHAS